MKNAEHLPNDRPEIISSRFFDINLSDLDILLQRFQQPNYRQVPIIRVDDFTELPPYVSEISLTAWGERTGEAIPDLVGLVQFEPELVEGQTNWVKSFLSGVEQTANDIYAATDHVPHDTTAIYVRIDGNYAVRVAAVMTLDECAVELSLVQSDELENLLGDMTLSSTQSPDTTEIITHIATLLGVSLDTLVNQYATPTAGTRYVLELVPQRIVDKKPKKQHINMGTAATNVTFISPIETSQPTLPEHEMTPIKTGLENLGGLFAAKRRLSEIAEDFGDSEAARFYGITPSHFLLHGQPGTGKTSLVVAFAETIDAGLHTVTPADISDKWTGGSAQNVKEVIGSIVAKNQPAVIFFDEIDALIGINTDGANQKEAKRLLQTMITETTKSAPNIVFAAATNAPLDQLDQALIRPGRFETISVLCPNEDERRDIWATAIATSRGRFDSEWKDGRYQEPGFIPYEELSSYDYAKLTAQTDGWTGADITAQLERARRYCAGQYKKTGKLEKVTNEILFEMIRTSARN